MADRPSIPKGLEKALFQQAASRCSICGERNVSALVVHHIVPYAETPVHDPAHMIVLCSNCHARADRGEISRDKLYNAKRRSTAAFTAAQQTMSPQTVIGQGNVVAGRDIRVDHLHIKSPRSRGKSPAPIIPGTVATDRYKVGYLKHLAKRYNEFKEYDAGKGNMRHAVIYQAYQREIKYGIEQTPLELFEKACRYLQARIENTKLGRVLKKRRQKLYSTFHEFASMGGKDYLESTLKRIIEALQQDGVDVH